jgi:hypothetical protein
MTSTATTASTPVASSGTANSEMSIMPLMVGGAGLVLLLTLLIGAALVAVCLSQWRQKTIGRRHSTVVGRPLPPMATNPIYDVNDVSPLYDVIPEPQWLVTKGKREAARVLLLRLRGGRHKERGG